MEERLMREGYEEMAESDRKLLAEWETSRVIPSEVWLVWGESCYYDHAVEAVALSEDAAKEIAAALINGHKPRNAYEHPSVIEYRVEHFTQTVKSSARRDSLGGEGAQGA